MSCKRKFSRGERYRPIVTVDKVKNGVPTVVIMSGRRYIYDPGTVNRHIQKRKNRKR